MRKMLVAGLAGMAVGAAFQFSGLFSGDPDSRAIQYTTGIPHNAVSELNRRIDDGKILLKSDGPSGYLRST